MWLDDLKEWTQLETYTDIKKTEVDGDYVPTRHVHLPSTVFTNTTFQRHLYVVTVLYSKSSFIPPILGISEGLMNRLQSVQNTAARLVTGTRRRCDHITLVFRQLHWLPVRVNFKVAMFVHRSLSGLSPTYLPTIAVLSPMLMNDDYAPQRAEHASLPGHTAVLATEPLQLRAPYYGTVFHRT